MSVPPSKTPFLGSAFSARPSRLGLLGKACSNALRKLPKPLLLMPALMLLLASPSQAGHWVYTLKGNGAFSNVTGLNYSFPPPPNQPPYGPPYGVTFSNGSTANVTWQNIPTVSDTYTLTVQATLTWTKDSPTDTSTPPAQVVVLESASAQAGSSTGAPVSASDGLGDVSVSPGLSEGSHLWQQLVPAGVTVLRMPVRVLVSSEPNNGSGYGVGNISYTVQTDSRELTITSFKTQHKNTVTGKAVPDVPDPDGTFEMTSIYSYPNWTLAGETLVDNPFINWIVFTPHYIGNWHWRSGYDHNGNVVTAPDVIFPDTWVWSPNESEDDWDYGKVSMGYGQISYQDGEPYGKLTGSQTYHVSLSATDHTDNATATAHANIALHDEWENKQNASPATTLNSKRTYAIVAGTAVGVSNNTSTKFTSPPTWTATINGSVTLGIKFGSTFDVAWAKMFGIEVNGAATVGGSIAVSVPGPLLNPGYTTYPFVLTTWITDNYLVDHYTVNGFEVTYPQSADDPNSCTETGSWSDPQLIGTRPPS